MGECYHAERIVRLHLSGICEQYHKKTVQSHSYSPARCTASLAPHQPVEHTGGDMNHVHRVSLIIQCQNQDHNTEQKSDGNRSQLETVEFSVVVKIAPKQVLFLKELTSEEMQLDPNKTALEFRALRKFHNIVPGSVPWPFLLDQEHQALIMEDVSHFVRLQDQLASGTVAPHLPAIEGAMGLIARVHKATWMDSLPGGERQHLLEQFDNLHMKSIFVEFLFRRPYDPSDMSNRCNPLIMREINATRRDPLVLQRVKELMTAFLEQKDCLCHGDFACDNILVSGGEFKALDLEFASIGLAAYDVAVLLETIMFQLICHCYHKNDGAKALLHSAIHQGMQAYGKVCGVERVESPNFVNQVCGLIGCEHMWRILGGYEVDEFKSNPEPELMLLSLGREFLLRSSPHCGIAENIDRHLAKYAIIIE